jgi:hypothetical protein
MNAVKATVDVDVVRVLGVPEVFDTTLLQA